ncbi:TetR family transcriptional regulator [Actinocorallia herbida]|uniref:TetR family transcriptional regulator n=1 Tax=Actinocorallia herbida TaxID=58109 RepID=A0A3N1D314_9ACTN|nr:TetR/AcrR family transcriptional regulator [Actinocorallia herbida]ROO87880.1 TetR family transcriptional regulator [Actinocorallia herbida]
MASERPADGVDPDLVVVSRRLFAALGYDGTSAEMIADAAGVGVEAIAAAGGKRALYEAVMEGLSQTYLKLYEEAFRDLPAGDRGRHEWLDRAIDLHVANPELAYLWQHRSLSDALDLSDVEERFRAPARRRLRGLFGQEYPDQGRYEMVTSVFEWCVYGFVVGGILHSEKPGNPKDPREVTRFRSYMHHLLDLVIQDRDARRAP